MTNSTKFAVTLALALAATAAVASGGLKSSSFTDAALPHSAKPGKQAPVRATKGDRLQVNHGVRQIAGVTLVLRDFDQVIR